MRSLTAASEIGENVWVSLDFPLGSGIKSFTDVSPFIARQLSRRTSRLERSLSSPIFGFGFESSRR